MIDKSAPRFAPVSMRGLRSMPHFSLFAVESTARKVRAVMHTAAIKRGANMSEDSPIIAEIRRIREEMLAEHGGDLAALAKHLQRRTEESARAGRTVASPATRQVELAPDQQKKAG